MIYLVSEKGQRTVKVGYTENAAQRQTAYATHSTVAQFIDWAKGTKQDETDWRIAFDMYGFEKVDPEREKSEWYYLPEWVDKRKLLSKGFAYLGQAMLDHAESLIENL